MSSFGQSQRSYESPMDFEWNGQSHGPTDPNSPFPKPKPGQKGGFGNLPQTPSSFMSAGAFKSAPSFRNPSFTTPRKPFDADLFSEASGIDSSPGDNADAEDTPEPSKDKAMTIFADKQPSFGRYGAEFRGNSPGRIDLRKGKYAQAVIANKARKRKRKDRDYTLSRTHIDSDDEDDAEEEREKTRGKAKKEAKPHWFGSILSGVESRPNLPSVLSTYLQLGLNLFLLMITIYMITMFFLTIRSDVDMASEKMKQEVVSEIAHCTQEYVANRCSKDMRVRAMEEQCNQWQLCMDMDPSLVGRARVSAKTFAQILDSFIEPISWKALTFIVVILGSGFLFNNIAFASFRKHIPQPQSQPMNPFFQHPPHQSYQWGGPPPTPQHNLGYDGYGQGYEQIMPSDVPRQRSPSKGQRSPSKGDRY